MDRVDNNFDPLITIPTPVQEVRGRGVNATGELYGATLRSRALHKERDLIAQAATALNMTPSAFIRAVCVSAAKDVLRRRAEMKEKSNAHDPLPRGRAGPPDRA